MNRKSIHTWPFGQDSITHKKTKHGKSLSGEWEADPSTEVTVAGKVHARSGQSHKTEPVQPSATQLLSESTPPSRQFANCSLTITVALHDTQTEKAKMSERSVPGINRPHWHVGIRSRSVNEHSRLDGYYSVGCRTNRQGRRINVTKLRCGNGASRR